MQFYSGPLMHFLSGVDTPLEAAVKGFVKRVLNSDFEAIWYFATRISEGRMVRAQNAKNVDCNNARKMVDHYENLFRTATSLTELEQRYKTGH